MPVGYEAFNQLADAARSNAVIKLRENRDGEEGGQVLRSYSRGFKRFISYFQKDENREVARAFSSSMSHRFGPEVAERVLAEHNFHRFETFGSPLHIRRVRAISRVAEAVQQRIKFRNCSVIKALTAVAENRNVYEAMRARIAARARIVEQAGAAAERQNFDVGQIAERAADALERAGGGGTHLLTMEEAASVVDAIIDEACRNEESSAENSFDSVSSAERGSRLRENGARSPSIDMPLEFEESQRNRPVNGQNQGTGQQRQSLHVDAADGAGSVRRRNEHAGLGRPPPATEGAAIEPFLQELYNRVDEDLQLLAACSTNPDSSDGAEIKQTVDRIRLAITRTMFDAQGLRRQPPPGAYHGKTIKTCWQFLLDRCDPRTREAVVEALEFYDRAHAESMYRKVRPALEALPYAGNRQSMVPVNEREVAQSVSSVVYGIKRAGHTARVPGSFDEGEFRQYWKYLVARHGQGLGAALAEQAESQDGALRALAEGTNWFRDTFLPLSRRIRTELASWADKTDPAGLEELNSVAERVALAAADRQFFAERDCQNLKVAWQNLLERHGDRVCATLTLRLAYLPDAALQSLAEKENWLPMNVLAVKQGWKGVAMLTSEWPSESLVGATASYRAEENSRMLNGLMGALKERASDDSRQLQNKSRRPELLQDREIAMLRNLDLPIPAPDRRGQANDHVPLSEHTRRAVVEEVNDRAQTVSRGTKTEDGILQSSRRLFREARFRFGQGPVRRGSDNIVEGLKQTCDGAPAKVLTTVTALANETTMLGVASVCFNRGRPDLAVFSGRVRSEWEGPVYELSREGTGNLRLTMSQRAVVDGLDFDGDTRDEPFVNPNNSSLSVRMTVSIDADTGTYRIRDIDVGYALDTVQGRRSVPPVAGAPHQQEASAGTVTWEAVSPEGWHRAAKILGMTVSSV